jgi:membrane-associated phospholipid phosphatase
MTTQAGRSVAIFILCMFALCSDVTAEQEYLSAGEIAGISAASLGLGYLGHRSIKFEAPPNSVIKSPPGFDAAITRWLGGEYTHGKQNFLDSDFGSAFTPIASAVGIAAADMTWPQGDKTKFVLQDLFLFGSGALATKGVTDLTKGIFKRQRPYAYLESDQLTGREAQTYDYTSFFSGHASSAFYSMTFVNKRTRSIMRHRLTPGEYGDWKWLPPVIFYGWASFVGLSRIQAYKHYTTDVAVGALVGWLVGELFFAFNDDPTASGGGESAPMMISFSLKF